jgi:hypothetical protein
MSFSASTPVSTACGQLDTGKEAYVLLVTLSGFSFTSGGSTYSLAGTAQVSGNICTATQERIIVPASFTLPSSFEANETCTITFTPTNAATGSASMQCLANSIYETAQVVSILYAPPGNARGTI